MANFNKIFLIGRLTKDPTVNASKSGLRVCRFSLAVNRRSVGADGTQKEETEFIDIAVMNRSADNCFRFLKKGRSAFVEGRLHIDTWTDQKTGVTRKSPLVIADSVNFLDQPQGFTAQPSIDPDIDSALGGNDQMF